MSERPAIVLTGVGKQYTLFPARADGVLDALGLSRFVPAGRRRKYQRFWALRGINLTLPRGARVGVVGRNGAGKSTLLKLITQNVAPTEGTVEVNGEVQALLQTGSGMHPDFTGYENIRAALTYQGLTDAEVKDAVADIEEFTELGAFLTQPFKTYSTGMQARLAFATATKVRPDILIIDEVLGVGDGYFLSKSTERIQQLIAGGATVLLVSHSMEQVVRFCEQALWVDRGQVVCQGDVLSVVKEYDRYLRELDERRLRGRNAAGRAADAAAGGFTDTLRVHLVPPPGGRLDVAAVRLVENDRPQETVRVGGPQDGATASASGVELGAAGWSDPVVAAPPYRSLAGGPGGVTFRLYAFDPSVRYRVELDYRTAAGPAAVELRRGSDVLAAAPLAATTDWQTARVEGGGAAAAGPSAHMHHWPGQGDLRIETVRLLDAAGADQTVFPYGGSLTIAVDFRAAATGTFSCRPVVTVFRRADGVMVTQQVAPPYDLRLTAGDRGAFRARLEPLNLGNDTYVFSVALFRHLDMDAVTPAERYDLVDRSFEFRVFGRESHYKALFQHPGDWAVDLTPAGGAAP